jgi:hypothetical protein
VTPAPLLGTLSLLPLLLALLSGCISIEPGSGTALAEIDSLQAFSGTYRNRALQADPDSRDSLNLLLSYHIWPEEEDVLHRQIDALRFTVIPPQRLRLEALTGGLVYLLVPVLIQVRAEYVFDRVLE